MEARKYKSKLDESKLEKKKKKEEGKQLWWWRARKSQSACHATRGSGSSILDLIECKLQEEEERETIGNE